MDSFGKLDKKYFHIFHRVFHRKSGCLLFFIRFSTVSTGLWRGKVEISPAFSLT